MTNNRPVVVLTILVLLFIPLSMKAADFSGTVYTGLFQEKDSGDVSGWEGMNLKLDENFGYSADLHLELGLESNQDEDLTTEINQLYLDYYTNKIDWRLGRQTVNWGSSFKVNPTSYFKKFTGFDLIEDRQEKGIKGVKAIYYGQNGIELTGALTPFAVDVNGQEESESQQAVKFTRRAFKGFDISFSYFHGEDRLQLISAPGESIYPEVSKLGLDINGSIKDIGIWTELVRSDYDLLDNQTIEGVLGSEYKFNNDLSLTGQVYYRQGRVKKEPDMRLLIFDGKKPVHKFHQFEVITIYDLDNKYVVLHPVFDYSLAEAVKLSFGGNWIINDSDGSMLNNLIEEGIYTELVVDF